MFNKIFKLTFSLLMVVLFITNVSEAQTKKPVYPMIYLSPLVGIQFPIMGLNDNYSPSYNAGLDVAVKINRETAFFINGSFYNMPRKSEAMAGPNASYIGIIAGPRYVFTSPKIKAQGFLEAGMGAYIFNQKEYTTTDVPSVIIPSTSSTHFGVSAGCGFFIPLGDVFDLIIKSNLHYTFEAGGAGGSRTFVTGLIGIDFKL